MPIRKGLEHILLPSTIENRAFTPVGGGRKKILTARQNRYLHAQELKDDIEYARQLRDEKQNQLIPLVESIDMRDLSPPKGICLEIEGSEHLKLDIDSLENRAGNSPIEVLNVKMVEGNLRATIYLPDKRLSFLNNKIDKYGDEGLDESGKKGLTISVDSIEAISLAELDSFWMDDGPLPENPRQVNIWEAWLRKGQSDYIRENASKYGIRVSEHNLKFQECEICLITSSLDQLALLQIFETPLVGFGFREPVPGFFYDLPPHEQADWLNELVHRTQFADDSAPAVCILDTGVKNRNPLLSASLNDSDCDSYDPAWTVEDTIGHGTQMAGLALMGDLSPHLTGVNPVALTHRLESVKIIPPTGSNPENMYGVITIESCNRAIVNAPRRKRVFCLAVTSDTKNKVGRPSAWSATIDKISVGVKEDLEIDDDRKQLFLISIGNIRTDLIPGEYPSINDIEQIENPSQSWNALSVGAITYKSFSSTRGVGGFMLLASPGQISPRSRTSVSWLEKDWPIKPEIVLEGGNYFSDGSYISDDPDLSLLTTGNRALLNLSRDTSAATAIASRMAAVIQAKYPNYWPETIRGLIVHSASWNRAMLGVASVSSLNSREKENILRRYGWGEPNLEVALSSTSNNTCLVSQHTIQPFNKQDGSSYAGYNELNIHTLPWPSEYLSTYSDVRIKLRVTLSYYIEPNPSKVIPTQKFSYASHGLRFDLQRPLETLEVFRQRVNKKDRDSAEDYNATDRNHKWMLGSKIRDKGCIISDIWTGTAAELGAQKAIAVIPEGGWWRYRKHLKRYNATCRYSLIISVELDNEEVDIYNEIQNQIRILSQIST